MRDLDQALGALAQRLAAQLRDTVFGHDVVDVAAAGGDWTACSGVIVCSL